MTDSERSITSTNSTLQYTSPTLNSSMSSFASIPPPPFDSQGNNSFSALVKVDETMLLLRLPLPFCKQVKEKEEPPAVATKRVARLPNYKLHDPNRSERIQEPLTLQTVILVAVNKRWW